MAHLRTNLRVVPRGWRVKHLLALLELGEHQTLLPGQRFLLGGFLQILRPMLSVSVGVEWIHILLVRQHDIWLSTTLAAVVFDVNGLGVMNHKLELVSGGRL